jgi:ferric-dicitrate binding protein FerR (iron transport regulator)
MTSMPQTDPILLPQGLAEGDEELDALDAQDALFCAYFDGELGAAERAAFDRQREEDPSLERSYQEFVKVMGGLRALPVEFAPDDFIEKVQARMRTRSRGRIYADTFLNSTRMPYEIIAIVMLITMGGAYLMLEVPHDRGLTDADFLTPPAQQTGQSGQP